jgi:hypothetical protein
MKASVAFTTMGTSASPPASNGKASEDDAASSAQSSHTDEVIIVCRLNGRDDELVRPRNHACAAQTPVMRSRD